MDNHANIGNIDPEGIDNEALEEVNFEDILDEELSDEELSDEEETFSDDSGCNSDNSVTLDNPEVVERFVPTAEILALNRNTKHCMIEIYYKLEDLNDMIVCATCMADDNEPVDVGVVHLIRRHQTGPYIETRGAYCNGGHPTFINIPCYMCPICMPTL